MAIKVGMLVGGGFTKLDNNVCLLKGLSDKAFRLYAYIASHQNGYNIREDALSTLFGMSKRTVRRYKVELTQAGLLFMDKKGYQHRIWVGNTKMSAERVMATWTARESRGGDFTEEELVEELNL